MSSLLPVFATVEEFLHSLQCEHGLPNVCDQQVYTQIVQWGRRCRRKNWHINYLFASTDSAANSAGWWRWRLKALDREWNWHWPPCKAPWWAWPNRPCRRWLFCEKKLCWSQLCGGPSTLLSAQENHYYPFVQYYYIIIACYYFVITSIITYHAVIIMCIITVLLLYYYILLL